MTIDLKKTMKKTSVFKKRTSKNKMRSVPSLIAKNKKVLNKLKPEDSENESDDSSVSLDDNNRANGAENESGSDESFYDRPDQEDEDDADTNLFDDKAHKKSLSKLKETDPEFYKYLEANDKKLLQFNVSDSESEAEKSDNEDQVHQPPEKLELDSDEDDFEEGEAWTGSSGQLVTLAMVSEWQHQIQTKPSTNVITEIVKAFQAALTTVSGEEDSKEGDYRIDGSSVFNAVVQLCVLELQPAINKVLGLSSHNPSATQLAKSKRWNKMKNLIKTYLTDLLKLLGAVSSANILTVLLKHLHQMTVFLGYYHSLTKSVLKQLVSLWSTSDEETARVIAFLCILRLTTNQQKSLLDSVLKMMYVAYISNSKFMSLSTLPNVTFMRRSLAEMFCLDMTVSYQHAFLYIRQLAIHLRNAITVHKKESIQAVCNWQYVNSLRLWVDLLCSTNDKSPLRALLYPLVQVITGCIKLVPTLQYVPLRFHCCQMLTRLSKDTDTYIPVLPFIVEALTLTDFNKKNKKMSVKPMDFTCVLRVSKAGLGENGFRDAIIEQVYQLLLEYCAGESHRISFPDVIVPAVIQLRSFVKECRVGKYSQKLRQVLAKMEENGKFVETERRKVTLSLADIAAVRAWENGVRARGTPIATFYNNWNKVHQRQHAKQVTNNDKLGDFKLPQMKRPATKKPAESTPSGPVELFPSDSDSDSDTDNFGTVEGNTVKGKKKTKRLKKNKKLVSQPTNEEKNEESDSDEMDDVVEELRLSDLE
ncbi:nucleolar complex protein 2 homolog [Macrosteles quadrilineatus]|uniref:nucleolar complex protein 2 homolog n=1 Tax=Macrosteles quadrilineatus TaxID=74068 RepID=UPI0023E1F70B|nr:nucleolar complex protein 2 homolog [Macrosteles quadrilineatus]XP_054258391.1 nucleolar complex protein 2 homolog [Macrosteles quadrilineatus]XP_054258392.1 nucleolar complex protein 2 homolog [Macrosteles quadrilineatus]